jgi:hypothetical protein
MVQVEVTKGSEINFANLLWSLLHYEHTFIILQIILYETFFQLEGPLDSLNRQIVDTLATYQTIGDSEFNCNVEEPGKVVDNQPKNRKPVAGREAPVNWNRTDGDTLIRKLFNTPDSKEVLIQAPPKVNLPYTYIYIQQPKAFIYKGCSEPLHLLISVSSRSTSSVTRLIKV